MLGGSALEVLPLSSVLDFLSQPKNPSSTAAAAVEGAFRLH